MQKKLDLKSATGFVTSKFGQKTDLDSLKSDFDRSEIDKLETSPVDLSELSNVVNNDVVKKTVYEKLAKNVDAKEIPDHDKYITLKNLIVSSRIFC